MPLVDFGILVALPQEFEALKRVFTNLQEITENADSWYRTSIEAKDGKRYEAVASFMTEMGQLEARGLTDKMIARWDPAYIILAGIAGSFNKDVRLGDVVVSQQIFYYDPGKAEGSRIKHRPQGYPCSMTLIRQHEALTLDALAFKAWQAAAKKSAAEKSTKLGGNRKSRGIAKREVLAGREALKAHQPQVHFGTVASGQLVIATKAKQREFLKLHGKILAAEMEAAGVLNATFGHEIPTPAIVVKGISDTADKDKATVDELDCWRELAAENSARVVLAMIERGKIRPLRTDQFDLELNRGEIAEARQRIKEVSERNSLLAFPQLVKLLGPLTGLRLDLRAFSAEESLEVCEIVVEYEDRNGTQRRETVKGRGGVEIIEPIMGGQVSVYLLLKKTPTRIEFRAKSGATEKMTDWSQPSKEI